MRSPCTVSDARDRARRRLRGAGAAAAADRAGGRRRARSPRPTPSPPVAAAGAIWPPRMPSAGKFEEVPLGKWAEYEERYLDAATIKERVALVAREADVVTLETTTETGTGDRTVFATVFAASSEVGWRSVTGNVFQVGDEEPMESPAIGPAQQPYPAVDPSKFDRHRDDQRAGRVIPGEALSLPHGLRRAGRLLDGRQRRADRPHQAGGGAEAARRFPRRFQVRAGGDGQRRDPAGDEAGAAVRRGVAAEARGCRGRATRASARSRPRRSMQ